MSHPKLYYQKVCNDRQFRVLSRLLPILFLCIGYLSQAQAPWQRHPLGSAKISVSFPEAPVKHEKQLHTTLGLQSSLSLTYAPTSTEDENFLYSAQRVEYPDGTFSPDSTELMLLVMKETIHALSENLKCKIIYESPLDGESNTLVFRLEDTISRQTVKGKVCIIGDELVVLSVFTTIEKSLNPRVDDFLSSLTLTENARIQR